jgi:hypothetical protein
METMVKQWATIDKDYHAESVFQLPHTWAEPTGKGGKGALERRGCHFINLRHF